MMKTSFRRAVLIIPLLLSILLIQCESTTWEGSLSLRGSEPHTQLVLTTAQGMSFELTGPRTAELARHQYRKVTISGRLVAKKAGPGFPAKIEVDKIIEIKHR